MTTQEVDITEGSTTRRGLKWGGVVMIAGALMLGSIATVAAADTGTPHVASAIAPQGAPDGTPTGAPEGVPPGPPEGVPPGPPEGVGSQAENGNGGRPDGVGASGHGNMPNLPEQASDQARAALEAVGERHALIAERIEMMRAVEPGPGRGEQVSAIAKDFGEQFRALAAALAAEGDDEEEDDE